MKIQDILLFNPIDNKDRGKILLNNKPMDINDFFNSTDIFIQYPKEWYKSIKEKLQTDLNSFKIITLHGAASKGKTTFLHYISSKDTDFVSKYNFCMFNLVIFPTPFNDSLIDVLLQYNICIQLMENKDIICDKYLKWFDNNKEPLGIVETNEQSALFRQYIKDTKRGKSNDFYTYMKNNLKEDIDYTKYLFLIFMTNHIIINEKEIRNKKNVVFMIDDLDELSTVYLTNNIYSMSFDIFSGLQTITRKLFGEDFYFNQWGHIILSFRDTNHHLNSPIPDSSFDIKNFTTDIPFDPKYKGLPLKEILIKRVNCFKSHTNKNEWDKDTKYIIKVLEILLEKDPDFFEYKLIPLFNYDGRAIITMIINVSKQSSIRSLILIENDSEYYSDISQYSKFGARGILYSAIFTYLYNYGKDGRNSIFYNIVTKEIQDKVCNNIRMGLTGARSLYNYKEDARKENTRHLDKKYRGDIEEFAFSTQHAFSMRELCDKLNSWYDKPTIVEAIHDILNITANNFEKFVLVDYSGIHDKKRKIKDIIVEKLYKWKDENTDTHLEQLKIVLLPASIIYSEDVFIHYEYCNWVRFIRNDKRYSEESTNIKTIFQLFKESNSINTVLRNTIKYHIDNIYKECSLIVKNADTFFCDRYRERGFDTDSIDGLKGAVSNFKENGFAINNILFSSRLITSHIQYLNSFRKYIFKVKDEIDNTIAMHENIELNTIVLQTINNYINLYNSKKEGFKDINEIFNEITIEYDKAIMQLDKYVSIDAGITIR